MEQQKPCCMQKYQDKVKGSSMKKISIGIPCYNEEENIEKMYTSLTEIMSSIPEYDYEIIFADNCSEDASQSIIRRLASKDKRVKAIFNASNFGPERSATNIVKHSTGDAYIAMPCDFQEPPEMIPTFVREWEKGYEIVWGQKGKSEESTVKYALRNIFYSIIDMFSDKKQLRQCNCFGIMSRTVLDVIFPLAVQDPSVDWRYLVVAEGFEVKLIPYTQHKRERGKSSYNASRYLDFALNSLINTSLKPLRVVTVIGVIMSVFSLIVAIVYFIYKLTHWYTFSAGTAPLIIGVFFLGSVQLLCMGMIGEYIGSVMKKVTPSTLIIERELLNFDEEKDNMD